jgi:hypothetical protein
VRFEILRLFVVMPLGIVGMMQTGLLDAGISGPLPAGAILYILASATALRIAARENAENFA